MAEKRTETMRVTRRRRSASAALALGLALAWAATLPRPAQSDEASEVLARYAEPVDRAIDKALAWLASQQDKTGAWHGDHRQRDSTAVTSLAVMAFLAKGHTPGVGPYGDRLSLAVDFILASQQKNGLLVHGHTGKGPMYNHNISTLMLSEVSGMVDPARQAKVDRALGRALKVILAAQDVRKDRSHRGGWRYQHTSKDSDISVTGWAVMALRSARNNGAAVPREAIKEAVEFIMNCRQRDGGFAYQPGGSSGLGRTGTALLCLELTGHHRDRAALGAGDYILKHIPNRWGQDRFFCYAMYYASQATFQLGGRYWERFGSHMYELFLKAQREDGSWPEGSGGENEAGRTYSTAMSVLAMSVSYRQLPIYQR